MINQRNTRLVAVGACMMAWSALAGAARITLGGPQDPVRVQGIVTNTGALPDPIPITEAGTVRQLIEIEPKTKGLKDAVVWLDGTPAADKPAALSKAKPVQMDQRDYCFVPHVLAVNAGQEVEFLNNDIANHGVSAASFEAENSFNMTTPPGGSYKHRFAASKRPVAIGCPIHAAMSAWIYVFDHPYHTVTDEKGSFRLPPVPPGRYTLRLRHPEGGMDRSQELIVRPGTPVQLRIEFAEKDRKVGSGPKPSR